MNLALIYMKEGWYPEWWGIGEVTSRHDSKPYLNATMLSGLEAGKRGSFQQPAWVVRPLTDSECLMAKLVGYEMAFDILHGAEESNEE